MKFIPANGAIVEHSFTFVVEEKKKKFRPAKVLGGRWSRSGKTIWPDWVEKGALPAYRDDCIPGDEELPTRLIVFSGHGTNPENIRELDPDVLREHRQAWKAWREEGDLTVPPPRGHSEEYHLARWETRRDAVPGTLLTHGEATRGVLERFRKLGSAYTVELTIADTPEADGRVRWEITIYEGGAPFFRAYAYAPDEERTPKAWKIVEVESY